VSDHEHGGLSPRKPGLTPQWRRDSCARKASCEGKTVTRPQTIRVIAPPPSPALKPAAGECGAVPLRLPLPPGELFPLFFNSLSLPFSDLRTVLPGYQKSYVVLRVCFEMSLYPLPGHGLVAGSFTAPHAGPA
jgi:hypothetical protein